jgi:hypothetical protein
MKRLAIADRLSLAVAIAVGVLVGAGVGLWVIPDSIATVNSAKRLISLNFAVGSPDIQLLKSGWSDPEPWGTWSIGRRAEIGLSIKDQSADVMITLEGVAFLPPPLDPQEVKVEANGVPIGEMIFSTNNKELPHQFKVPRAVIARSQGYVVLAFVFPRTLSPADVGQGADNRKLGIGLRKLKFLDARFPPRYFGRLSASIS